MSRNVLITVRRGTEAQLSNVTLAEGELGFTVDTHNLFMGSKAGNILITGESPSGSMLKSIYDTDNDGIVDTANNAYKLGGYSPSDFILKGARSWNQLKGMTTWAQLMGI